MSPAEFVARLDGVKRNGHGWSARCPAHDDREASLSIGEGDDGRVLLKCFAGCDAGAIAAAVGLKLKDLYQCNYSVTVLQPPNGKPKREELRIQAAKRAREFWEKSADASGDHAYLLAKQVKAFGIRAHKGALLIPVQNVSGELTSLQFIHGDGIKKFLPNGQTAACFHLIGEAGRTLCVAEGYSTAASIYMASGYCVAVAFYVGNLEPVARGLRAEFPDARIIMCADNDIKPGERNSGVEEATKAALAVDGLIAVPEMDGQKCDFNDLHQMRGVEALRNAIANAKPPGIPEHQLHPKLAPGSQGSRSDPIIAELARLQPLEYDRVRHTKADALGVRVATLDTEVARVRDSPSGDERSGRPLALPELELWPEPVNVLALLNELVAILKRYLVLPPSTAEACALWIVHTYAFDLRRCSPILAVRSPEKRCGKSTLLALLQATVSRALPASNISPSAVYRTIEKAKPTLLIDEADSFLRENEELRGVLNSGHTRELAFVIRNVGNDFEPRQFSTWAPKALALIGKLPDTLHDRAIVIPMQRKSREDHVERFEGVSAQDLRRKVARWVADHADEIKAADPKIPQGLHDRAADNWRPLLALADLAGGAWPEVARDAALALSGGDEEEAESNRVLLLADLRQLFEHRNTDRLSSADIVKALGEMEERPWHEFHHGKPITQRQLAGLLKPFGIRSNARRSSDEVFKGYLLKQFSDVFTRYLPANDPLQRYNPSLEPVSEQFRSVTPDNPVTDQKTLKAVPVKDCNAVTDRNHWSARI